MNKYSIQPVFNYSDEDLIDIISTGLSCIGYWCDFYDNTPGWDDARNELPKDRTIEDVILHVFKQGEKVIFFDIEDCEEEWELTLDKLLNGIKLTIQNKYWDGDIDTLDGEGADIIFQYALFNEIVFG